MALVYETTENLTGPQMAAHIVEQQALGRGYAGVFYTGRNEDGEHTYSSLFGWYEEDPPSE